ncbi:MAG TPA: bifunctional pyr operon transcriptional regulator/uracil phosphoribosyltransferase PyrR [Saprospiraceae bacterium]|nr:bifunctional pyr operon transcriptional regulator/uracil phosphoribosyltransferase PyrR [Saprospiraceae bacterium]
MNTDHRILVDGGLFNIIIHRLTLQLIEDYGSFDNTALVGIQPRGAKLLDRIANSLEKKLGRNLSYGKLDISFYRDDFRRGENFMQTYTTDINFTIEGKTVVLVDDVLYTGRSVNAALSALNHYGRASKVALLTLVNRRFDRQLPIMPNYVGLEVDALDQSYVKVNWKETDGSDGVVLKRDKDD